MFASHNKWVYRAAINLLPRMNMTLENWSQKEQTYHGEFSIKNRGLGRLNEQVVDLQYNQNLFNPIEVYINEERLDLSCDVYSCNFNFSHIPVDYFDPKSLKLVLTQKPDV